MLRQARASKRKARAEGAKSRKAAAGPSPERQLKKLEPQLGDLTEKIAVAEAKIEALNARFCEENFYRDTPPEEHAALEAERRMLEEEVRTAMSEWESLEEQAEALRGEIEPGP